MNSPFPFRRLPAAAALAALALLSFAPSARAEDGEEEPGSEAIENEIQKQMQKILTLMRENEAALLAASRAGGEKPKPVEVKPPDEQKPPKGTEGAPQGGGEAGMGEAGTGGGGEKPPAGPGGSEGGTPGGGPGAGPGSGGGGVDPRARGEAVRKSLEELLEGVRRDGERIPKEIEELIRMIPVQSGSGSQPPPDDGSDPKGGPKPQPHRAHEREETKGENDPKDPRKSPEDPAKKPESKDGKKPPEGEKGDETKSEVPPWIVNLPPEFRPVKTAADIEKMPEEYRELLLRYLKWQAENPGKAPR